MNSPTTSCYARVTLAVAAFIAASLAAACGSSSQTVTEPAAATRCSVTLERTGTTVPASGGTGSVAVRTQRECAWSASSQAGWLSITDGASGQGEGTLQFRAAVNADPVSRTGGIVANGERTEIVQAAAECRFELVESSGSFPPAGGSGGVDLRASSAMCTWTVSSEADWILLRSASSGSGSARVSFDVAAAGPAARSGSLTIAGQRFTVLQSGQPPTPPPPAPAPQPPAPTPPAPPPPAPPPPTPTPTPPAPTPPTPTPPTPPAPAPPAPCSFTVSPTSLQIGAEGGKLDTRVTAGTSCAWTSLSLASWIKVESGAAGEGSATVRLEAERNRGDARVGLATVAGATVTIRQESGCRVDVRRDEYKVDEEGGRVEVKVEAGDGCSWTAVSRDSWIRVTRGASGSGDGTVELSVDANQADDKRSGTVEIGGVTVKITQEGD